MSTIDVKCHGCGAVAPVQLSVLARHGQGGAELTCRCGSTDLDVADGEWTNEGSSNKMASRGRRRRVAAWTPQKAYARGLDAGGTESAEGRRSSEPPDEVQSDPQLLAEWRRGYRDGRMYFSMTSKRMGHVGPEFRVTAVDITRPSGHVVPMREGDTLEFEDGAARVRYQGGKFYAEYYMPHTNTWLKMDEAFDTFEEAEARTENVLGDWDSGFLASRKEAESTLGEPETADCPNCGSGRYSPQTSYCPQCGYGKANESPEQKDARKTAAPVIYKTTEHGMQVEVQVAHGLPSFTVINWPKALSEEMRKSVAEHVDIPERRITVNLPHGKGGLFSSADDVAKAIAEAIVEASSNTAEGSRRLDPAKVAKVASAVIETNPGIDRQLAMRVAEHTVRTAG